MYAVLPPTHDAWKLSDRFNVSVVPDALTLDPAPLSVHWLFDCDPLPGAMEPAGAAPASVSSVNAFCARLYITLQALTALTLVLNRIPTVVKSAAPELSENWNANNCCGPPPDVGDMDMATTGAVAGISVTADAADIVVLAWLTAVTVTVC